MTAIEQQARDEQEALRDAKPMAACSPSIDDQLAAAAREIERLENVIAAANAALLAARQCITQIAWTGMEKSDVLARIDAVLEAKP